MNKSITLNGREITYELERKNVKNINLRIRFDCSVYVSANTHVTDVVIEGFLQKNRNIFYLRLINMLTLQSMLLIVTAMSQARVSDT